MQNNYYDIHADNYTKSTFDVDMSALYSYFLKHLKPRSRILDAGCGSGRDSLAFKKMGHIVTAFDVSPAMVGIASKNLSQPVLHCAFEEISFYEEFDAVWACASLLHVPLNELPVVLNKLFYALVQEGILYMSFKYGNGERITDDGRFFTDLNEEGLRELIAQCKDVELLNIWKTNDCRPKREHEIWLNAILCIKKQGRASHIVA